MSSKAQALALLHGIVREPSRKRGNTVEILANFLTRYARIVAYNNEVQVRDLRGGLAFTLYGSLLNNLSVNDRFVNHMAETDFIQRIVGYTPSDEINKEGYADIVVERRDDGAFDVGLETDVKYLYVMMDLDTVYALIRACEIALSGAKSFICDRDYWVIHAEVDGYKVAMSGQKIEVMNKNGRCVPIPRKAAEIWRDIFDAADELEDCLEGSYQRIKQGISVTRVSKQIFQVAFGDDDNPLKYRFSVRLCRALNVLINSVWFFFDSKPIFELVDDEDDEGDYETGGSRS